METLQTEMLMEIFLGMSTQDLLHNCRMVSRRWCEMASSVCRKRFVNFDSQNFCKNTTDLSAIFQNLVNLPWSSVSLNLSYGSSFNRHIVQTFAPLLTRLTVSAHEAQLNYYDLIFLLGALQNLKVLLIKIQPSRTPASSKFSPPSEFCTYAESSPEIRLPMLREASWEQDLQVKAKYADADIEFMASILRRTGWKLKKLFLNLLNESEQLPKIFQALANASPRSSITLDVLYAKSNSDDWRRIGVGNLPLTNLKIRVYLRPSHLLEDDHFSALEKFLASNGKQLEKLEMVTRGGVQPGTRTCQLPPLPELRILRLRFIPDSPHAIAENTIPIYQIVSAHFQNLVQLVVTSLGTTMPCDMRQLLGTFDKIKVLSMPYYEGDQTWASCFPNVLTLTLNVMEVGDFGNVLNCMVNLKSLLLIPRASVNADSILKSFLPPFNLNDLKQVIIRFDKAYVEPSLNNRLSDAGVHLLLLCRPCQLVVVGDIRVSTECISRLQGHVVFKAACHKIGISSKGLSRFF